MIYTTQQTDGVRLVKQEEWRRTEYSVYLTVLNNNQSINCPESYNIAFLERENIFNEVNNLLASSTSTPPC